MPFAVSTASQSRNYKLQFTFGTGYTDEALSSGLSLNEEYPHVPVSPLAGTTLTYTAARTL